MTAALGSKKKKKQFRGLFSKSGNQAEGDEKG